MRRLFPHPLLFLGLLAMWLLLVGNLEPGQILLGAVIAFLASWAVVPLEPPKPKIRRLGVIVALCARVVVDIAQSNIAVFVLLVTRREPRSTFVRIPLRLREPNALALLAGIVTATPGSAWIDYDATADVVIIHVLDTPDGDAWAATLKHDYESRLLEIFQ